MQQREVEIINKLGLHARAAAKLTQLAAKYQCDVSVARNGRKVNAKSIMSTSRAARLNPMRSRRCRYDTDACPLETTMRAASS